MPSWFWAGIVFMVVVDAVVVTWIIRRKMKSSGSISRSCATSRNR